MGRIKRTRDDMDYSDAYMKKEVCLGGTSHSTPSQYSHISITGFVADGNTVSNEYHLYGANGGDRIISRKRAQQAKIHTERHQKTIAMMMEAAKQLSKQEQTQPALSEGTTPAEQELQQVQKTFRQKPFW